MTAQSSKNQQQVSPVLLVILGIVIIGGGGYYAYNNFMQPASPPVQNPIQTQSSLVSNQNKNQNNTDNATKPAGQNNPDVQSAMVSNDLVTLGGSGRDPFIPSKLYLSTSAKSEESTSKVEPAQANVPQTISVTPIQPTPSGPALNPTPTPTPKPDIIWAGTVASDTDQVVIIRYKNKSFSLRLGDQLPGTKYIVAQVTQNSVVLLSPNEKLPLFRKKEEKR